MYFLCFAIRERVSTKESILFEDDERSYDTQPVLSKTGISPPKGTCCQPLNAIFYARLIYGKASTKSRGGLAHLVRRALEKDGISRAISLQFRSCHFNVLLAGLTGSAEAAHTTAQEGACSHYCENVSDPQEYISNYPYLCPTRFPAYHQENIYSPCDLEGVIV